MQEVISFFTGAGGLDIGLEKAGLAVVVGQELDPLACVTSKNNGQLVVEGDLKELLRTDPKLDSLREHLSTDTPFAVVGGPPCQSFSTAGRRGGVSDPRGTLIFDYLNAASTLEPRFIVLENVKGLLSTPGFNHKNVLGDIETELSLMGYSHVSGVVDAVNYGAPQFRERLLIIASRDDEPIFIPKPTHFQHHQSRAHRWRTLADAVDGLPATGHDFTQFSDKILQTLSLVPEGGNWKSLPTHIAAQAMGGAWESGGGKVGFFRRLRFSEPSPTLVTSPIQKATMLAHPTAMRPLSVQEYARIQGFPDTFDFYGSLSAKYRQIGNAVPVALGEAVGESLLAVANNVSSIQTKRRRGTATHKFADSFLAQVA
jgi:DNA (cytosine-5)-methyltransferase 1